MGKTLENKPINSSLLDDKTKEEQLNMQLPIPFSLEHELMERLRGYNIAIYDGKIVALNKSLRKLHETLKTLIPNGERCEIEYIEEGASIYGFNF